MSFDITLADSRGVVLAEIVGFRMKRLTGSFEASTSAAADASAQELGFGAGSSAQPLSPEERRLQLNIANGISAGEGGDALSRALAVGLPQVVVSSLDLHALIEQAAVPSAPTAGEEQSFERPQLDTDYVAPRNNVEETLAGFYASLLGVSEVGVEDSFFDLGGHSLIAVRLFAQVKRAYDVEFPISVLFEAPSVAALSEMIIRRTGGGVTAGDDVAEPGEGGDSKPQFRHLVQLHPGDGTGRRPFFLVAGMFGNVLNLRHLALMVGRDRPVYGLQARGLIGEEDPHSCMEEAARDYLEEVRTIQPEGPYLLGGFSGGGITAYEMARQLDAAEEDTGALIMLDTPLPVRPPLTRADKAIIKWRELRQKGIGYLGEWLRNRIAWEIEKRRDRPAESGQLPEFNNRKIELAFYQAVGRYELHGWDGPMTLFRPPLDRHWKVARGRWVSAEREYVFEDNDWTRWAPRIQVIEVPGNHDSMVLVPNVSVLAAEVKAILDVADAKATQLRPEEQVAA